MDKKNLDPTELFVKMLQEHECNGDDCRVCETANLELVRVV